MFDIEQVDLSSGDYVLPEDRNRKNSMKQLKSRVWPSR
jgi:hypothetical protein